MPPLPLHPSPQEEAVSEEATRRSRGRPRLANPRRHVLHVRCTADEHAAIHQAAADAGIEVADFLRDQVVRGRPLRSIRRPKVDREQLAQVLAELHQLGPWLNDLARAANAGERLPKASELAEITARTRHMRDLLNQALRDPSE